jgi:uncharacterized protein YbcI
LLLFETLTHLVESARPAMESMIADITGVKVVSLHHDIGTPTGEEVVFTPLCDPASLREIKKK